MKFYLECLPCYMKQILDAAGMITKDTDLREKIIKESLAAISEFKTEETGLVINARIYRVLKKYSNMGDPYKKAKLKMNRLCLDMTGEIKRTIKTSKNPFETNLRIVLGGNIIDVGQGNCINEEKIKNALGSAMSQKLDKNKIDKLKENIKNAKKILYIGDNAGEIVFDRIFIEKFFPMEKTTYVVRGGPVMNDSTMDDAIMVGMTDVIKVIDTGIDMPGAMLPYCSREFLNEYHSSDLIISKGMGNYEALSDENKNIFYLLKIKCPVIENSFKGKYRMGDIIVENDLP